jgi:hypothetical protein
MIIRLAAVVTILVTFIVLGMPGSGESATFRPPTAAAAPADSWSNGIQFSTRVSSDAQPVNPRVEFGSGTDTVWASFELHDHDPRARVSYLVRANGEDYKFGKLDCCDSSNGRFAFPITKRSGGGDLPGASYDVRVYVNDAEVAQGGFGVNGRGGLDNDGQQNDND